MFERNAAAIVDGLLEMDVWTAALAQAPDRHRTLDGEEIDELLRAVADFVDLKCPSSPGYSRGVADLAAGAARHLRKPSVDVTRLYRAGLVHGLGRLGVSNQIWEKRAPLSTAESERLRMYPYLTGRILSRVGGLESVVSVATKHEERIDGSGFPRGLAGQELSATGPSARRGGGLSPTARATSGAPRA